jgi:hypothetical protein
MNKSFDCVAMKHKGAEKIRKKIAKLSIDEEISFWKEKTASFKKRIKEIKEKSEVEA